MPFRLRRPLADHLALFRIVGGCTFVLRVRLLVLLGGVVVLLFGGYRLFGVLLGIGFERFDLVPHRCKAFDYGFIIAVFPMTQRCGVYSHELYGFFGEVRGVRFVQARTVGAVAAPALAEQGHVIGVVGTRHAEGLVEPVAVEVGRVLPLDVLRHVGSFQTAPTVVPVYSLFQMIVVHVALDVFSVAADFARHADRQLVRLQELRDFGYQGEEFQSRADVVFALAELNGQRGYVVATVFDELLIGVGLLHGADVLTLQVFRHGHLLGLLVRNVQDDSRDFRLFRHERGAIAAFAEDNLEAAGVGHGAHADRLQDPLPADACGEFGEGCFIESLARVVGTGLNVGQGQRYDVFSVETMFSIMHLNLTVYN